MTRSPDGSENVILKTLTKLLPISLKAAARDCIVIVLSEQFYLIQESYIANKDLYIIRYELKE